MLTKEILEKRLVLARRAVDYWQGEYKKAELKIGLMRFFVPIDKEILIDKKLKITEGEMKQYLKCVVCGRLESLPFEVNDACPICDGILRRAK